MQEKQAKIISFLDYMYSYVAAFDFYKQLFVS